MTAFVNSALTFPHVMAVVSAVVFMTHTTSAVLFVPAGTPGRSQAATAVLYPVSAIICVYKVWHSQPSSAVQSVAGVVLLGVSLALYLSAAWTVRGAALSRCFSPDVPRKLISHGPWRYVRHPCYTAYICGFVSSLVLTTDLLVLPAVIVMASMYTRAALHEEAKFKSSPLAKEYEQYRTKAGMFWPLLPHIAEEGPVTTAQAV